MSVVIIDYGSGNLHSAQKAFERASTESGARASIIVSSDPDVIRNADRIVLPGVGAFADCRRGLDARAGVLQAMSEAVIERGRPFLGICVGMQLLASRGLEHGVTLGLDWVPGDVVPIEGAGQGLRIPHMGWNTIRARRTHPLLDNIPIGDDGLHAYFVHSYHLQTTYGEDVLADTEYGQSLAAVVTRGVVCGTQFHPEKSQKLGLALIANFLRWRP